MAMQATSTFPNIWKCSSILPILNKNKPKHDPESYRPIMITPVLGKVMEKMITIGCYGLLRRII